mmetsp:Transcript_8204/g.15504  ORF Transcript_8204/g.15504 Transcript_8204/m.15504 type:complete len:459 (+) Transcript_8204:112-1488(+)
MEDADWVWYGNYEEEQSVLVVDSASPCGCMGFFGSDGDAVLHMVDDCTVEDLRAAAYRTRADAFLAQHFTHDAKAVVKLLLDRLAGGDLMAQSLLLAVRQCMLERLCYQMRCRGSVTEAVLTCSVLDDVDSKVLSDLLDWAFPALLLDHVLVIPQEVLVFRSLQRKTALVINMGMDLTVFAVYEGFPIVECTRRSRNCPFHWSSAAFVDSDPQALEGSTKQSNKLLKECAAQWVQQTGIEELVCGALKTAPIDCRSLLVDNVVISARGSCSAQHICFDECQRCVADILKEALVDRFPCRASVHVLPDNGALSSRGLLDFARPTRHGHGASISRDQFESRMLAKLNSYIVPSDSTESRAYSKKRNAWSKVGVKRLPIQLCKLVHDFIPMLPEKYGMQPSRELLSSSTCSMHGNDEASEWYELWAHQAAFLNSRCEFRAHKSSPLAAGTVAIRLPGLPSK